MRTRRAGSRFAAQQAVICRLDLLLVVLRIAAPGSPAVGILVTGSQANQHTVVRSDIDVS